MYSEAVLRRARSRLDQARQARERELEQRRSKAYADYPRLAEIEQELRRTMTQLMAAAMRSGEDPTQAIARVRKKNLELQREREWILEAASLGEDYLDEVPVCPKCGGRGYLGSTMCDCLRELCRQEQKKELTSLIGGGHDSFDAFRLELYPATFYPEIGTTPRQLMQSNFNLCRRYAQGFTPSSESLLFSGGTGLGKTFLSACIARQVVDRGYSVVYETAGKLFADYEAEKFSAAQEENRGLTRKYLDCDLLILDDLGTEMTTLFTVASLYSLINTRMMDGRPTIISTNLTSTDLEKRYSAQIASRIAGTYRLVLFAGEDIRRQ